MTASWVGMQSKERWVILEILTYMFKSIASINQREKEHFGEENRSSLNGAGGWGF